MQPHVVTPEQRPLVMSCPYVKAMLKMGADFTLHIQARCCALLPLDTCALRHTVLRCRCHTAQEEELHMLDSLAKVVDGDTAAEMATNFDRVKGLTSLMPGGMSKEV